MRNTNKPTDLNRSDFFAGHSTAHVPYAAIVLDEDYRVCSYGRTASLLFGFGEVAMIGNSVSQILPKLEGKLACCHEGLPACPSLTVIETEAQHASGWTFPVAVGIREHNPNGSSRVLLLVRNLVRPKKRVRA